MATTSELVPLLLADDIVRSLKFYRDMLGFSVVQQWEPDGKLAWCRIERDQVALMLQQACAEDGPAVGRGRGVMFYFHCTDAVAEYTRLCDLGLQLSPPEIAFYGMQQLFLRDLDGYELCFQNPTC